MYSMHECVIKKKEDKEIACNGQQKPAVFSRSAIGRHKKVAEATFERMVEPVVMARDLCLYAFKDGRDPLPQTNTQGGNTILGIPLRHDVQQAGTDPGTGRPERMA